MLAGMTARPSASLPNLSDLIRAYDLSALAAIGSRARGDFGPMSDLDLIGVGKEQTFYALEYHQLHTELHVYTDLSAFRRKASWWYALDDMRIIRDDGSFGKLRESLPQWRAAYRSNSEALAQNQYWLKSLKRKLENASSKLSVSYHLATSTWQLLTGAFLIRDLPVPASSDMLRHASKVVGAERLERLLTGDYLERKETALTLIDELTGGSK